MAAPFNPSRDFLRFGKDVRTVGLQLYNPADDSHATAQSVRSQNTRGTVTTGGVNGGEVRTVVSSWWLLAEDLSQRPTLESLIVDSLRGETWAISSVDPDPAASVYRCSAVLTVTFTPVPVASFAGAPLTGIGGLVVQFTDQSTGVVNSWLWNFGDGNTSTAQNPSHTYTAAGTYTVTLTATNSTGSHTLTRTGYVVIQPTSVTFGGQPVTFTPP